MTAQIISLVTYRSSKSAATAPVAAPTGTADRAVAPAPTRSLVGAGPAAATGRPVKSGESTIVAATAALSAACREMAVNLAMLMTHAEAACNSIGEIGDTAEALVKTGIDLGHVADGFKHDHDLISSELSAAGLSRAP